MASAAPLAPMPPGHWLVGHLRARARDPLGLYLGSSQRLGDVVRYRMGYVFVDQLTHPDHVEHVLVGASANYVKGTVWDKMRPLVGNGLVTAEGEAWKRQRRLVQPVFHRTQLSELSLLMTDVTESVLQEWTRRAVRDDVIPVFAEMRRLTLTVVIRALFGVDLDAHTPVISEAFTRALEVTDARIISPAPYLRWLYRLPTIQNRDFRAAVDTLDAVVERIITQRRSDQDAEGRLDLLGLLMAESAADPVQLDPRQLRDEVMTLLMAGYETTATSLSWTLHLLAQHPDVADNLRYETEAVLGGRTPTAADLAQMPYLRGVIQEAMRLYPPVWAIPRVPLADDEVDGYRIPRGDIVILVPYVTHRHPDYWPDPERFDPTRFLSKDEPVDRRWSYFPFGVGRRHCLGNHFAMMEAQLVLAMVTQRFRLTPSGRPVAANPYVTLRPDGDMPMQVTALAR